MPQSGSPPRASSCRNINVFELERANEALDALRSGSVTGSVVLRCRVSDADTH
jgi:hypothetical protein